jgi:hypothetical protein
MLCVLLLFYVYSNAVRVIVVVIYIYSNVVGVTVVILFSINARASTTLFGFVSTL